MDASKPNRLDYRDYDDGGSVLMEELVGYGSFRAYLGVLSLLWSAWCKGLSRVFLLRRNGRQLGSCKGCFGKQSLTFGDRLSRPDFASMRKSPQYHCIKTENKRAEIQYTSSPIQTRHAV